MKIIMNVLFLFEKASSIEVSARVNEYGEKKNKYGWRRY